MKICLDNKENSVKYYEYFDNKDIFIIIIELNDKNLFKLLSKRANDKREGFDIEEKKYIKKSYKMDKFVRIFQSYIFSTYYGF